MPSRELSAVNTVLSELEWDEGLTIPVANAENKVLESEVQSKQKQVTAWRNDLSNTEDRVHALTEHLRNVRQELQHSQALLDARKKEKETEDHFKKIADREEGRLRQEIRRLENEIEDLKEQENMYENNVFKQTQKLQDMKSQMNWDQQALEAWLEESAQKDEEAMVIAKYSRQDEAKIKELSLKVTHLMEDKQKKRRQLDHEYTETMTAQIEMDKTAEEFRRAHAERQELISQWEQTIEQMQRRDKDMDHLAAQLAVLRSEVRDKEALAKEKQQFFENEKVNNSECEKTIDMKERLAARTRQELQDEERECDQFNSEVEALKRTKDRTAMELETARAALTQMKKELQEKCDKYEKAKETSETLRQKLKMMKDKSLTAEERAASMEQMLEEEERRLNILHQELKKLRELHFKKSQELFEIQTSQKNTLAEIQGTQAAIGNLNIKINKLDSDSLKQQEIIYNQDFSIQQLERRLSKMQGEQSNEEKVVLEAKIKELNENLSAEVSTKHLLIQQIKRLQEDIRKVKRDLEKSGSQKADLMSKMEEINLHIDSSQRELRKVTTAKQELMVDESILKLQIKKLRDSLYRKADDVTSLEKRRLQLDTAMKERCQEINIHVEMLTAQLKSADAERRQIAGELHERLAKIEKLKKRFEICMVAMAPPEGEEEKSQAYYVIKAAQDKEELQREGDELDAKIRKAEKEIKALENTLFVMNNRNETYRKSFNKVSDTDDEMLEKQQLEEQERAVREKYKYRKRQIRELHEDLQTMSQTLDNLSRDQVAYTEMNEEKQNKITQMKKELTDQGEKLNRVDKQLTKQSRELKSSTKCKGKEQINERDFDVRELRELTKQAMKRIADITRDHPEMTPAVQSYFMEADLSFPAASGPGSVQSSLHGSRASMSRSSSLSSVRSSVSSQSSVQSKTLTPVNIGMNVLDKVAATSARSSRMSSSGSSARSSRTGHR